MRKTSFLGFKGNHRAVPHDVTASFKMEINLCSLLPIESKLCERESCLVIYSSGIWDANEYAIHAI
jgi:hypothetical protein